MNSDLRLKKRLFRAAGIWNLKSKIVLQVHDELLIEAYENEVEQVKDILKRNMEQAAHLTVPLDVDVQVGNNWDEAH